MITGEMARHLRKLDVLEANGFKTPSTTKEYSKDDVDRLRKNTFEKVKVKVLNQDEGLPIET